MEKFYHPYHMVNMSPWPLMAGFGILSIMMSMIKMFSFFEMDMFLMSMVTMIFVSMFWWRDVIRESTYQGHHSSVVLNGLMVGMILFIVSEVFFFISFFWTFFHSSLGPNIELGALWPPVGIIAFNPFQVPLLNTVILLASGVSITWCHQAILKNNMMVAKNSLMITWMLGLYFLMLQWFEYKMASFGISDSVYGSIFFMTTGFHGFHVIVGTLFLFLMWLRMLNSEFSNSHHFGFEAAAWYWHFVDVVWLFLFSMVYWWGL
uniref:cytochrome c oxidase subunit III n=1 Tax=Cheiracanthium insigne TaxID=2812434 RepID=UPI0022FD96AB|nr:cytochrome c oxidase subunit III [Cheiracanthium insigne]WBK17747.1 cytochrome c oxidase subunit III [Cheiracanthium insigne]